MNDTVYDNRDRGADEIGNPPAGAVNVLTVGSWDVLFSEAEQNIYIVAIDYHPEPFRISLAAFNALQATISGLKKTERTS